MLQKLSALQPKDYLTLANAASGTLSIVAAVAGISWFWLLIPLALLFDWLDGWFARFSKTQNKIGVQLDSLADIISFGVAPFIAAIVLVGASAMILVAGILFVLAGVIRLAHFNLAKPAKTYSGLPVTGGAVIALLFILVDVMTGDGGQIASLALFVLAFLEISEIRFPSLK